MENYRKRQISDHESVTQQFRNLRPQDVPVIFRRSLLENRDGKWVTVVGRSTWSASGKYNYICKDGATYVGKPRRAGHVDLARGETVTYAGQIMFSRRMKRGKLLWWNNESGHYRPSAEWASQAGLPIELFREGEFGASAQRGISMP